LTVGEIKDFLLCIHAKCILLPCFSGNRFNGNFKDSCSISGFFDVCQTFLKKRSGVFPDQAFKGHLFFLPERFRSQPMDNAALISGAKFFRHDLGMTHHAERNLGVVPHILDFSSFDSTVKIDVVVDEAIIQGNAIGLMIRRHGA